MVAAFAAAQAEAQQFFGDPAVFVERQLTAARHVEVQVIADGGGTVWAVGIRDCSIQQRNQKVIEESGCTLLDRAASGNRPAVLLANLSGFDGSPESMRKWQLEYGAEIGRAVTNFRGPIVFVVVSRYHGGAFVVFSKRLHEDMDTAAVAGSFASVIGGAPAAAVVLSREVTARTLNDPRVAACKAELESAVGKKLGDLRAELADIMQAVRSEKLKEVADEFDNIHDIKRAMRVGSVDRIIAASELRPLIVHALEHRLAASASPDGTSAAVPAATPA